MEFPIFSMLYWNEREKFIFIWKSEFRNAFELETVSRLTYLMCGKSCTWPHVLSHSLIAVLWKPCAMSPSGDLCNLHMKHNGIFRLFLHGHLHGISSCICKCSKIWTNFKAKVFLVLNIWNKGCSTCLLFFFWNLLENIWLDSILL